MPAKGASRARRGVLVQLGCRILRIHFFFDLVFFRVFVACAVLLGKMGATIFIVNAMCHNKQ